MFGKSVTSKIPIVLLIVLIVCNIMNHYIKKKAFEDSIDEHLAMNCMVGAYTNVSKDDLGYVICTEYNIKDIVITDILIHYGLFSKTAMIDVDITIQSGNKIIKTTGYLKLQYNKNENKKWYIEGHSLNKEDIMVYE